MNEPSPVASDESARSRAVFVSFSSANSRKAMELCKALEARGVDCWISSRDVAPGENYQEAIVRAIKRARAMVLVFSEAANRSDEIKKELSLASRHRIPVIAARIENVEPSDAFAYEFATRQWVDSFEGWDASADTLAQHIGAMAGPDAPRPQAGAARGKSRPGLRRRTILGAAAALFLVAALGAWWFLRTAPTQHSMSVRLAGFQLLSPDLPPAMRDTVNAEIAAAFNADGVVGVSTASAPQPGAAPAYALGGTIQRDGPSIRVITRLTNERSGTTLWTDNFNYDGKEVARVPRHIAVDAGNVVRCGLFGASTYGKALPDAVFRDYMQFCQGHWDPILKEGRKALVPAQRVVAAVPDFSWGWAGVAGGYWKVADSAESPQLADQARASGREAADRAIAIDSRNSEALYIKAVLLDRNDWVDRESLFKSAVAARRLDCGCEYHQYGWMLVDVGRVAEGVEKLRRANDMLALYVYTKLSLANALVAAGKPEEAKTQFDAAIDLAPDAAFAKKLTLFRAIDIGDGNALLDPSLPIPEDQRSALLGGYRAAASRNADARAQAVRSLLALPEKEQIAAVAILLASLGASHDAFQLAARITARDTFPGPSLFFYRSMRPTLDDPGFPAVAKQLGLMNYWKTTRTRPDVCAETAPPPFCRMI